MLVVAPPMCKETLNSTGVLILKLTFEKHERRQVPSRIRFARKGKGMMKFSVVHSWRVKARFGCVSLMCWCWRSCTGV